MGRVTGPAAGSRASPRRRSPRHAAGIPSRIEHDLVHRQLELADHREQGVDGRLRLAGLDLRDQARRYAEPAGQLAQSDVLLLARSPQAMAGSSRRRCRSPGSPARAAVRGRRRFLPSASGSRRPSALFSSGVYLVCSTDDSRCQGITLDRVAPTSHLDEPRVVRVVVARREEGRPRPVAAAL